MLDIKTCESRIETILRLFQLSLSLLKQLDPEMKLVEESCKAMLELTYRTYTDEQYNKFSKIKELSTDIIDFFQSNLDKKFFVQAFNEVQQEILKKRSERKMKQKVLVGTLEGQNAI